MRSRSWRASCSVSARTACALLFALAVCALAETGVGYYYYEGEWDNLPDFSTLTPLDSGVVDSFSIAPRGRDDRFAFKYSGYISIADSGDYTFYTASDDGSKLYVNGTQIVDNDGLHSVRERSGTVSLPGGYHQIEVTFFEKTGGEGLEVRYMGPGVAKTPIPSSVLSTELPQPSAPAFVSQPPDTSVLVAQSAVFEVSVTGNPAPSLQWYRNDSAIAGRVSATLTTDPVTTQDNGASFFCTATNSEGSATSDTAVLTVTCSGGVLRHVWTGIQGMTIEDLTGDPDYPDSPDVATSEELFEAPTDWADYYGTRMFGYVHPPDTGNYVFWIAGDDSCELWLSTDENPDNKVLIASVDWYTDSREWTKLPEQESAPIALDGGRRYFIEALHKEHESGDNLAVGWQLPDGTLERPIPGIRLSACGPESAGAVVSIDALASSISEASPSTDLFTVSASLPAAAEADLSIAVSILVGGSADNGIDYDPLPTVLVVAVDSGASQGSSSIAVAPVDDSDEEGAETLTIEIQADTAYTIGSPAAAEITIEDTDEIFAPAIEQEPADQTVYAGQSATFSLTASGSAPLSYQWRKNGSDMPAADSPDLQTPILSLADNLSEYQCVVSNTAGSDTSRAAVVEVLESPELPRIEKDPVSTAVAEGDTAFFHIVCSGAPPLTYQWHTDTGAIAGAVDSVIEFGPVGLEHDGTSFYCVVSNSMGTIESRTAFVTVMRPSSEMIVVSGELYDAEQRPVGAGSERRMDFTVRLYPSLEADSAVYTERFLTGEGKGIRVSGGDFVVRLGEGATSDDLAGTVRTYSNLFVEFSVTRPGGNPEVLQPRTPLTASPYALSGLPELLRGDGDPVTAGITAPIGTHYVNNTDLSTYIRTHNGWVELRE